MARSMNIEPSEPRRRSPASTPEDYESVLVSKALRLIEQQIDDGTASSQILAMYGKLGSSREKLEQEKLRNENAVLRKKVETMEAAVDVKVLMESALQAFRGYAALPSDSNDDFYDD